MKHFLLLVSIVLAGCLEDPKKVQHEKPAAAPRPVASAPAVAGDYVYLGKRLPGSAFTVETTKTRLSVTYDRGVVIEYGELKPVSACLVAGTPSDLLPSSCRCMTYYTLTDNDVDGVVNECEERVEFSCLSDQENEAIKPRRTPSFAYCKTDNSRLKSNVDALAKAYAEHGLQTQKMLDLPDEAWSKETAHERCSRVEQSTALAGLRDRRLDAFLGGEVKRITAEAIQSEDATFYPRSMTAKRTSANKCMAEALFRFTLVDEAGKAIGKLSCTQRYNFELLSGDWDESGDLDCEEEKPEPRNSQAESGGTPGAGTRAKNAVRKLLRKF